MRVLYDALIGRGLEPIVESVGVAGGYRARSTVSGRAASPQVVLGSLQPYGSHSVIGYRESVTLLTENPNDLRKILAGVEHDEMNRYLDRGDGPTLTRNAVIRYLSGSDAHGPRLSVRLGDRKQFEFYSSTDPVQQYWESVVRNLMSDVQGLVGEN